MSVMGFKKKKIDGGWVYGWGELYPSLFWIFLNLFNFTKPLRNNRCSIPGGIGGPEGMG